MGGSHRQPDVFQRLIEATYKRLQFVSSTGKFSHVVVSGLFEVWQEVHIKEGGWYVAGFQVNFLVSQVHF